jgi:hypothetical protein
MRLVERYGQLVWENEEFEDQRTGNCMCHFCARMKPGDPDHCEIAAAFYAVCKEHGCAFILTRCAKWVDNAAKKKPDDAGV